MDPIMIQIGPLAIRWYGFLIALGVLFGTLWAMRIAQRRGLDPDKLLDMAPYLVLAGIVGARLVYVLTSPSAFFGPGGNPVDVIKIWQGGISIRGGILGVLIAMFLFGRFRTINMWAYADTLTLVAALGIIGGRIGNFMNGTDTGGRLTEWAIGFRWPEVGTETFGGFGRFLFGDTLWQFAPPICRSVPSGDCVVHLAPAYGALVGVILIFVALWALARSRTPGFAFTHFVIWYSLLRSLIEEPFRDNPLFWQLYLNDGAGIGILTLTQLVSIPIVLIALYALFVMEPEGPETAGGRPEAKG
jgi:phosphatidylglycerol:prolipoprotein diacylglycerol transferase